VSSDKRARRLKHLLKLNHATFSILYNRLRFHNHSPHVKQPPHPIFLFFWGGLASLV
jgi:hypothetical protein